MVHETVPEKNPGVEIRSLLMKCKNAHFEIHTDPKAVLSPPFSSCVLNLSTNEKLAFDLVVVAGKTEIIDVRYCIKSDCYLHSVVGQNFSCTDGVSIAWISVFYQQQKTFLPIGIFHIGRSHWQPAEVGNWIDSLEHRECYGQYSGRGSETCKDATISC